MQQQRSDTAAGDGGSQAVEPLPWPARDDCLYARCAFCDPRPPGAVRGRRRRWSHDWLLPASRLVHALTAPILFRPPTAPCPSCYCEVRVGAQEASALPGRRPVVCGSCVRARCVGEEQRRGQGEGTSAALESRHSLPCLTRSLPAAGVLPQENVWHLAAALAARPLPGWQLWVVFISNAAKTVRARLGRRWQRGGRHAWPLWSLEQLCFVRCATPRCRRCPCGASERPPRRTPPRCGTIMCWCWQPTRRGAPRWCWISTREKGCTGQQRTAAAVPCLLPCLQLPTPRRPSLRPPALLQHAALPLLAVRVPAGRSAGRR